MNSSELYYEATESKTKFQSVEPDQNDLGLDRYHQSEERAILDFLDGDGGVLAMGGMAGTGKSFTLENIGAERNIHYVDLHSVGQYTRTVSTHGANDVAEKIIEKRVTNKWDTPEKSPILFLDEGISCLLDEEKDHRNLYDGMDDVIRKFADTYTHIVIAGGGSAYTSDEQTELIAEALPDNLSVKTHSFPFKALNVQQATDMIKRANLGMFQNRPIPPGKFIDETLARAVAGIYIQYFRYLRGIILTARRLVKGNPDQMYYNGLSLQTNFMPDSCFNTAILLQREQLENQRDELEKVLAENKK